VFNKVNTLKSSQSKGAMEMLTVKVSTGKGLNKHTGIVQVYGFDKLTPRAARAALQIAGYHTGEVWSISEPGPNGPDYDSEYGYRVYPNTARKLYPWTV
jgi:hypothetical protein